LSCFLGIARERVFSPGRVEDDRLILEAVAEELAARGHAVSVRSADDALAAPSRATTVFTMSQGERALARLREWESAGLRVVNSVGSILGCHRHRLLASLRRAGLATPEFALVNPGSDRDPWPDWLERDGGWLKRGDVHATEPDDVVRVHAVAAADAAAARLRARGIEHLVVQRHVEGAVTKFYAVAERLVAWYSSDEMVEPLGRDGAEGLQALAAGAARALGLEVHGGDVVTDRDGRLQLIDLNDWPSFARCRAAGARAIAARLETLAEQGDR
jgi:hypothetical protein